MTRPTACLTLSPLFALLMLAAGCKSVPTVDDPEVEAGGLPPALALMPPRDATGEYRVLDEQGEIKWHSVPFTIQSDGESWVIEIRGRHRLHTRLADDGAIVTVREDNLWRDAAVRWETPLVLIPAGPGENPLAEQEVSVEITNLDGTKKTASGTAYHRLDYLGPEAVTTPAGTFDCHVFRQTRRLRLGMATVDVVVTTAYAPGVGKVATTLDNTVRYLGLVPDRTVERTELVSHTLEPAP